jgi:SpoVK/Ycf46/Vps4 family AAA+-type ATPase
MVVLLHGLPGTGKTETVYQLAKQTQRNIYKVDISETKSMWFGESQKLIKKVFNDYHQMMKTESDCPILLFNEADGIISKRKELGNSNTAETENAIQNIILEEMENFEGILFATTNLVKNMDAAFERRFLFKLQFDQPSLENAAKIWKNKLPFLTEDEARRLAERFPFSGGEIENITRKCVMNDLLTGSEIRFQQVVEFCKQEKWTDKKNVNKIGF